MLFASDAEVFIDLNGIATIEQTDNRGWLIIDRYYLPNGKRIGCIEFPPEPSIDEMVEQAIADQGCDCHLHGMSYLCCRVSEYEMAQELDDAWFPDEFIEMEDPTIDTIIDILDGKDVDPDIDYDWEDIH